MHKTAKTASVTILFLNTAESCIRLLTRYGHIAF